MKAPGEMSDAELQELGEMQTAIQLGCDDWYIRRRYPELIAKWRAEQAIEPPLTDEQWKACEQCDGAGLINNRVEVGEMAGYVVAVECPACQGTGTVAKGTP